MKIKCSCEREAVAKVTLPLRINEEKPYSTYLCEMRLADLLVARKDIVVESLE